MQGLASVTKALALKTFNASEQVGATQWDSEALFIHTGFGPPCIVAPGLGAKVRRRRRGLPPVEEAKRRPRAYRRRHSS